MHRSVFPSRQRTLVALLFVLIAAGGCVRARLYRPESVVSRDDYDLAFVEFDDHGELWSPAQVLAADRLIRGASTAEHGAILTIFIHGWQHNAAVGDKNVAGFESLLSQISALERSRKGDAARRTVGVYIGWRGKATPSRLLAPITFFSRFRGAKRVAGTSLTEAILRLLLAGRGNPTNTTVALGHSFGGLILESALAQLFVGAVSAAVAQDLHQLNFPADLVLLVNPASQAIEAKKLIDIFERNHVKFLRQDAAGQTYEVPLVVSMTSTSDLTTRVLFPIGMRFKGIGNQFRSYGAESCARGRQAEYFRHTAGHERALHSHLVAVEAKGESESGPSASGIEAAMGRLTSEYDPVTRMQTWSAEGEKLRYSIHQNPRSWNDTPYWVMEVPPAIIPNHYTIFGRETIEFAGTVIAMSGALEGSDHRARLIRDDRVRPVVLATRSDGSVSFLDRSQRIFELASGDPEPNFVNCVPGELTAVEDVIGVAGTGEVAWVAGTIRGYGKKADEVTVGVTQVGVANRGLKAKARSLPNGYVSRAAVFDLDRSRMFVARETEPAVDVVDLTAKKLQPEPLLELESSDPLRLLAYDPDRNRLFGSDGQSNLIVVDLAGGPESVVSLAEDLDLPSALAYDRERHRLYLTTAGDGTLWKLECESACGAPVRVVASRELTHPRALAVDANGMVWVGDIDAGILAGISPEGEVVRRIERLPEE